jgi:large subunit ribosomal protein L19
MNLFAVIEIAVYLHPFFKELPPKDKKMSKNELIKLVEDTVEVKKFPKFTAGDTISVTYKIKEGNKERLQKFQGVVLQRVGSGPTATFTVRKISNNIGVERIFPISSPSIEEIVINKVGVVRRARLFYFRELRGKKARIKEKRV